MPAERKSLGRPDEVIRLPEVVEEVVDLGELTVGRTISQPGWRWSTHVRPLVGGEWCQARHIGVVLSGCMGVAFPDGSEITLEQDDVYDIAPGHDGFVVGEEPCVSIEWAGLRTFAGAHAGHRSRALVTLLLTDLVDSTVHAARLGDTAWRELLARHFEAARSALDRFGGVEVKTTGDGLLARFAAPVPALRCAAAVRDHARVEGVGVRAGVHIAEVELVGDDVRGVGVHEAARIMAQAREGEILVSATTRALAHSAGLAFEDRGTHELKGLDGQWALSSLVA